LNYYEHHIRDYDAATSHLSWDEDLAYTRLLRWYYRKERPVPADVAEACRQVRATTKVQRDAVGRVLHEFFDLRDDGWHQQTCDEVIAAFQAGEPEREVKKGNEDLRMKRHRDERAALFKRLNAAGQHAPWNTKIEDLRRLVQQAVGGPDDTPPATGPATTATRPATGPATPATATQTPVPSTQSPLPIPQAPDTSTQQGIGVGAAAPPPPDPPAPPPAAAAASTRGTRLPRDWALPKVWGEWALGEYPQWTAEKVRREAAGFADHWHAKTGKDGTKLDWLATWRNWCRDPLAHRDDPKAPRNGAADTDARNAEAKRLLRIASADPGQETIDA
jgi:uncharacterized protein YdaU (DUF1376 family)